MGVVELAVPPEGRWISVSPLNKRRWQNFKANRRGYWSLWIFLFLFVISLFAEFIANDKPILYQRQRPFVFPGGGDLSRHGLRQDAGPDAVRHRRRLPRSLSDEPHQEGRRLRHLAADPLLLQHPGQQAAVAVPVQADLGLDPEGLRFRRHAWLRQMRQPRIQLARHRRRRPRRDGAADLRLPHLGAVRPVPDHRVVGHRRRRRRGAGLFRRLDRPPVPALHRDMDLDPLALSAADHLLGAGAGLLRAAGDTAAVFLGVAGRAGARGIPARAQFRIRAGRARARRIEPPHHLPPPACPTPWWRP